MALDMEKPGDPEHIAERKKSDDGSNGEDSILNEFSPAEQQSVMHRIDRRLVTTVGAMYCVSLMDRTNLGAVAIAGMNAELKLNTKANNGMRYNIITLVFFATYVAFQPPATAIIRWIGPRIHLSTITLLWGVTMIGMGFVKDWNAMWGLRLVLGFFEAGFFPGSVYLLSTWYIRYEVHKRYSVFYLIGSVASAFSAILAYGFMQMEGLHGYHGWSWIFIMQGVLTIIVAFIGYALLVGFPDDKDAHKYWNWLSEREIKMVIARVNADRGDAYTEPFSFRKWLRPALDPKIWGFGILFAMTTTVSYAMAYFLPIILREGMKFSLAKSQCLVAPPYAFAGILMYATAWVGDRYHIRGPLILLNCVITIIGLPIMGWAKTNAAQYVGVYFVCMGANANVPAILTYQANNIRGHWHRAFSSAMLVGMGGVGGIAGSLIFRTQDKPKYRPGMYACIATQLVSIIILMLLTVWFKYRNRQADKGKAILEGIAGFRYTL